MPWEHLNTTRAGDCPVVSVTTGQTVTATYALGRVSTGRSRVFWGYQLVVSVAGVDFTGRSQGESGSYLPAVRACADALQAAGWQLRVAGTAPGYSESAMSGGAGFGYVEGVQGGVHIMSSSAHVMARSLHDSGGLKVRWHPRLDLAPAALPGAVDLADKVEGMMLGLAIGDALGNTSESINPGDRRRRHGWIDAYLPNRHAGGRAVGLPSDDTQLAFWTVEHLNQHGRLDPQLLGEVFCDRQIFGMGQTMRGFVDNFRGGLPWHCSGDASAGNGALMRIAPVLLPHLTRPSPDLWADTLMAAHLTHDDTLSNASCLAMVDMLWRLIGLSAAPDAQWWVAHWLAALDEVGLDTRYAARNGHPPGFEGTAADLIRQHLLPALRQGSDVLTACSAWHSGAYLLETVPTVLYILARHGDDPREAMLQAVNHTRDNDTAAAIVGAAMGALHGASCWPSAWVDGLLGRTTADDDGQVFRLLADAGAKFGFGASARVRERAGVQHGR